MNSFEHWKDWDFDGLLIGQPFTLGVHHKTALPGTAREHYIWIGGGAFRQEDISDNWYLQVALRFSLNGSPVGSMLWSDASTNAVTAFPQPNRPILRVKSDGSGSVQPTLRMQVASNGAWFRDNLDIGCFYVPLPADAVEYEVEEGRVSVAAGRRVSIRTGFRIMSF